MPNLLDRHRQWLKEDSGLTDDMINSLGWYSVTAEEASQIIGFTVASDGIAIPYPNCDWVRIRLDKPMIFQEKDRDGSTKRKPDGSIKEREAKYLSPLNSRNHAFILPQVAAALNNPLAPIGITEGEKKAAKATQEGLPTIAVPGVWSWLGKTEPHLQGDTVKTSDLLAELAEIDWTGRTVYLFWDSDAFQNHHVLDAGRALQSELRRRGANARLVPLQAKPGGVKVGLDDFLKAHSLGDLIAYAKEVVIAATQRNFDIIEIEKITTDPPLYSVLLSRGTLVSNLSFEDLMSYSKFRAAVGKIANRLPVMAMKRGEDRWGEYLNDILETRLKEVDAPPDTSASEVWRRRALRAIDRSKSDSPAELAETGVPWSKNGRVYFDSEWLYRRLTNTYREPLDKRKLWAALRFVDAKSSSKRITWEANGEIKTKIDRYWSVPVWALAAEAEADAEDDGSEAVDLELDGEGPDDT